MNLSQLYHLPSVARQFLVKHELVHQVLANAAWIFTDRGIRLLLGLFVGVWVARYLGPAEFGLLSYAVAFTSLFSIFSTLGLDPIIVREMAREPFRKQEILGSALVLRACGAVFGLCLAAVLIWLFKGPSDRVMPLVLILSGTFLFQAFDCIDLWFQASQQNRLSVFSKTSVFLIATGLRIVLIIFHAPLIYFAGVILFEAILAALALMWMYQRSTGEQVAVLEANWMQVRLFLSEGFPLFLSGFAVLSYMRIDQIMLGEMLGAQAVGVYAASSRLVEASFMLPTVLMAATIPSILKFRGGDHELVRARFQKIFLVLSSAAYVIAFAVYIMAGTIVEVLYGTEFQSAAAVLRVQILSLLFVSLSVASGHYLTIEKHTYVILERAVMSAVASVALNVMLIPRYHLLGAAWAMVLSHAFAGFFLFRKQASRECLLMMVRSLFPYPYLKRNV